MPLSSVGFKVLSLLSLLLGFGPRTPERIVVARRCGKSTEWIWRENIFAVLFLFFNSETQILQSELELGLGSVC